MVLHRGIIDIHQLVNGVNMVELLKRYMGLFDNTMQFIGHKSVHVLTGVAIAMMVNYLLDPVLALAIVMIVAIVKELYDDVKTAGDYQEPLFSNILDIIVTTLGGVLGLAVYHIVMNNHYAVVASLVIVLLLDAVALFIAENS